MKYAVAMSGGVDSSTVLAYLTQFPCNEVQAFTMKLWDDSYNPELKNSCFGYGKQEDIKVCEDICRQFNVKYTVIDLSKEFKNTVVDEFTSCYKKGITPNPCVTCNKHIKFGLFVEEIKKLFDFDYFTTGHYANIHIINDVPYLKRVYDDARDQTYFLWQIEDSILSKTIFPLAGAKDKNEVRELAKSFNIPVAEKKDSMSFADGKYHLLFTDKEIEESKGKFIYNGCLIGEHKGIVYYTLGQRAKISGHSDRLYIKYINTKEKNITVDTLENVVQTSIVFSIFYAKPLFNTSEKLFIKLKQEGKLIPIDSVEVFPKRKINISEKVILTPGQSCVIYNEDGYLVAGGII